MNKYLKFSLIAAAALALAGRVSAVPTLMISDGTTTYTIADGAVGDANGSTDAVTFIGTVGVWTVNVTTGIVSGTNQLPTLDLNSVDMSSGAGTLYIYFSADGFGPSSGGVTASVGGTTSGTTSFKTAYSASDLLFRGSLLTGQTFTGPAFSGTAGSAIAVEGLYSLTELAVITHTGSGTTSFDMTVSVPDSGTTVMLLGAALTALGLFARSRKQAA